MLAPAFCASGQQVPVAASHASGPISRAQSRSLKAAAYIGGESRLPSKGASHFHFVFEAGSFMWRANSLGFFFECKPGWIRFSILLLRCIYSPLVSNDNKNRVVAESRDICRSLGAVLDVGNPCEHRQIAKCCAALERRPSPLSTRAHSVL